MPFTLISLAICMISSTSYLVAIMYLRLDPSLKYEAYRILVVQFMFTLAYITRAILFEVMLFTTSQFWAPLLYYFMYNIWDVVPIMLVMCYHSKNV